MLGSKMMLTLIIQIVSLIMILSLFYLVLKINRQLKMKVGKYYEGALKIGEWGISVSRYALPFLLIIYAIGAVSLIAAIASSILNIIGR